VENKILKLVSDILFSRPNLIQEQRQAGEKTNEDKVFRIAIPNQCLSYPTRRHIFVTFSWQNSAYFNGRKSI
jgi:hypothetical protein